MISSNCELREQAIDMMVENFEQCGYSKTLVAASKQRAMVLEREPLLRVTPKAQSEKSLIYVATYNHELFKLRNYIKSLSEDITTLIGHANIMLASRRNKNTAAILFNRFGFAQNESINSNQKCGKCLTCNMMFDTNDDIEIKPGVKLKLSKTVNCKSDSTIYVAICKLCKDFYFGQTLTPANSRVNGHRNKFNDTDYAQSALSFHIKSEHPDQMHRKAESYNFAILEQPNPVHLNRRESYYIWKTEADIRHLNRIKVVR